MEKRKQEMKSEIKIENLKCGGCAATIKKGLSSLKNVNQVEVDVEKSIVAIQMTNDDLKEVKEKLSKLGYPEVGDKNTVVHKAKSFVSCAVGRMDS
jgi:copper chaperone